MPTSYHLSVVVDDAAQGVARLVGIVDLGDHGRARLSVQAPHRVGIEPIDVVGQGQNGTLGHAHGADRERVRNESDAELAEERSRNGAESHTRCGLARARALEHRPRLVEAVLLHADEIGVTGARARERRTATARELGGVDGVGAHDRGPLGPLGVADAQGDRASHAHAVAHAARDRQLVLLELHARSAPVAELAALHVGLNRLAQHGHARG